MRAGPGIICLTASFLVAVPAAAGPRGWSRASDRGRNALVIAALGAPAVQGDWHGDVEAAESLLAAGGVTYALKELVRERRPDGSDNRSFPSGHTSISFAAAATLEKRYGWTFGAPAFAVATLVGAGRVAADKHYVHDVLAGATIGATAGWLLTSRHDERVRWLPWAAHGGGGMTLSARW
ncbi:phosphatase PAP2 family protein [Sphingomonas sp. S-NIH.Pt1_0416]|uniref:phosphatase PAP2 family protein n=1 Tax=Sphingomonas sp. S-NIH.Pt1_0416 TaxID=1920123 RepID=UPI000F7E24A5|nr:phosphatase PAP2 family protein [Sphingomonas sp. S-NIH.Pt1_0416]RSU65262.1 phosphatase PAP2 family protein [Sphingomonas sp. S-NIH.Pt1_0416]